MFDDDLPDSVRMGQRITTMTSGQKPAADRAVGLQIRPARRSRRLGERALAAHGQSRRRPGHHPDGEHRRDQSRSGVHVRLLPVHSSPGRPSMGAWVSYGLGSLNENLPAFVVLHSTWSSKRDAQAVFSRLVGLRIPAVEATRESALRSSGDPVLYLSNPPGVDSAIRRRMLDALAELNQKELATVGDPEINTRIAQYEMAYRMQTSVPELTDSVERAQARARPVRPRRAHPRERSPSTASWPGGWPSGMCGSSRSSSAAGTITATCRPTCGCSAATSTSPAPA